MSTLLNKRTIMKLEVISKVGHNTNVRVQYINNRYEQESILQLTEKEYETLIAAIKEQTEKPVVVKTKPMVNAYAKKASKVKSTLKCQHCQEEKPRDQFTIVNVRPSAYCNSCNEEFARQREERLLKNGETALWRLVGFESKADYIANRRDRYVKWNDGYEILTSGKWRTMINDEPSTYRWKGRVFRTNGGWMATSRNGMVRVTAKTREDAVDKLMDEIYSGALSRTTPKPKPIKNTHASPKPKKSGFWAAIKSVLGLKGSN
ncbi:hypothetical protein [Neobacillus sp. SAB-20_R2A]|uniref:hypothetical protein n=1 Tax=Neobacillus sp. SAB-20_R2A TaxID=3120519 RepID=UPI003C6E8862